MPSYDSSFFYEGKEIPISVSPYWQIKPPGEIEYRWLFRLYINNYFQGSITKTPDGVWVPFEAQIQNKNDVFVLQAHDYEIIGEMIEENFPEYV